MYSNYFFPRWHLITTVFTTSWKSLSAKTVSQCNVVAATCFDMLTFLGFLSTMTMISKFFPKYIPIYRLQGRHEKQGSQGLVAWSLAGF